MSNTTAPDGQDTESKRRITITLDADVLERLADTAKAQRDSISGMANRMLAVTLGLMPRAKDEPCQLH